MVMFFLALVFNMGMIGIAYAVYGRQGTYAEGMILGVHLPEHAALDSEVQEFVRKYRRQLKRFWLWNTVAGILVCIPAFWYISVFMVTWGIWIFELFIVLIVHLYYSHRRLYDMKVRRGWIGSGESRIMAVDTKVSAGSGQMVASAQWHLVLIGLILLPCILPGVRAYLQSTAEGWLFFGTSFCTGILFWILHRIIRRTPNKVYSEDSKISMEVNRLHKNVWSYVLIISGISNMAAFLAAAQCMDAQGTVTGGVYAVYWVLEGIPGLLIVSGFFWTKYRKKQILQKNREPLYIDDDVYWKNGWYSNPHDKRLMVQDWVCTFNYSMNMARPAAKVITGVSALIIVVCMAGLIAGGIIIGKDEFRPVEVKAGNRQIEITSGESELVLPYEKIEEISLLDELPEDHYRKVRGFDSSWLWLGEFKGRETGKCQMFFYRKCEPVIELRAEDGTAVYVNSKKEGLTEEWYEKIISNESLSGKKNQL